MSIQTQLAGELKRLAGFANSNPTTITLSGPDQVDLAIDFTAVDSLSCALREIRLSVPALVNADSSVLKTWAEDLCRRVTYLLENIGPLEVDPAAGQVLIRSTPPDQQDDATSFYEVILKSHAGGNFSLRRYRAEKSPATRDQVDFHMTHEVLDKLVNDLVETVPDSTA